MIGPCFVHCWCCGKPIPIDNPHEFCEACVAADFACAESYDESTDCSTMTMSHIERIDCDAKRSPN
jgi:hypothetical protein